MNIVPLQTFHDNYIWMIMHPGNNSCVVVDPGLADPVLLALHTQQLTLAGILITHHHWDHTNGIESLLAEHPVPVFGPATEEIPCITDPLREGDIIEINALDLRFHILDIPGHTRGHIAYYGHSLLFSGDTLFTGGCGRLFEGTAQQMHTSLQKLAALPEDTLVYCGHEYTQANLRFAQKVEPENLELRNRVISTQQLRMQNLPTVPALLSLEKATNPFLRTHLQTVKTAAEQFTGKDLKDPVEVFAAIRHWKDGISYQQFSLWQN